MKRLSCICLWLCCLCVATQAADLIYIFAEDSTRNAELWMSSPMDEYTSWTSTKGGLALPPKYDATSAALSVPKNATFTIRSTRKIDTLVLYFASADKTFSPSSTKTEQHLSPLDTIYACKAEQKALLRQIDITYALEETPPLTPDEDDAEDTPEVDSGVWTLITHLAQLREGLRIVIVAAEYDKAMSQVQNANNRSSTDVTKQGDTLLLTTQVQVLTLVGGFTSSTWALQVGEQQYLYAASSTANYLRTQGFVNSDASWSIDIVDGIALMKAQGNSANNQLCYNKTTEKFSCYATNNQSVVLYGKNLQEELPTHIDDAGTLQQEVPTKMLYQGRVYIIHRGLMYDLLGQPVGQCAGE